MNTSNDVSNAVIYAISRGYQIHPDAFAFLKSIDLSPDTIVKRIISRKEKLKEGRSILLNDIKVLIGNGDGVEPVEPGKSVVILDRENGKEMIYQDQNEVYGNQYEILFDPTSKINSAEDEQDYINLFQDRYRKLLRILSMRPESRRIRRISAIKSEFNKKRPVNRSRIGTDQGNGGLEASSKVQETVFVAGLLMSRRQLKNVIEIGIDDISNGLMAVASTEQIQNQISTLALDQMVMLELDSIKKMGRHFSIKNIILPDIPDHVPNKSTSDSYLVLISDLHVGSKYFMETEFVTFIKWLSSDDAIAKKVKFVCIAGDIVDGIGIFPDQDRELNILDSGEQIMVATKLLQQIRKDIEIFMIPGNHDIGRRALPQSSLLAFMNDITNNFHVIGNPSLIKLNGVKVLMFHGQSLDDIIATTPGLSYSNPVEAMRLLLKARHLSPVYGQRTPIAPEKEDMLVITDVPDIFHAGHVHIIGVGRYKSTLIVNSGAWQAQTRYQMTMGIVPTPGIAILVDLSTLQPFQKCFTS